MVRTGLAIDIQTQGTQSVQQAADAIKLTRAEMERFKELGDWTNATKQSQELDKLTSSFSKFTQANQNQNTSSFNNAHSQAQELYDSQQKSVREQISRLGNTNPAWWRNNANQYETKQRGQEITRLVDKIEKLNDELDGIQNKMEGAKQSDDTKGMFQLSAARQSTEQEKSSLEQKLKSLIKEDNSSGLSKYFGIKEFSNAVRFATQGVTIGNNYRQDIASGNYTGAEINKTQAIGSAVGGAMTSIGLGAMLIPIPGARIVGGILAGAGALTTGITDMWASGKNADKAEAEAYERMLPAKNSANRVFNNVGSDYKLNAKNANALVDLATTYGIDTGLSNSDILQYSSDTAKYGISDKKQALQLTRNAGLWNQETGADINQMLAIQGISERYGLGKNILSNAYGAAQAGGLTKGQFNEYLQGLQTIIETGISNGYLKSADEINKNLTLFTRLSDNSKLWQGQNVVNNLNQMNSGLAASTSMSNVSQTIAEASAKTVVERMSDSDFKKTFGREKTGTYLDYEMALQNPSEGIYAQVLKDVQSYYGSNIAGQTETLKQIFGISSTGTILDLIGMTGKIGKTGYATADVENIISASKITPDAKTEETEKTNHINNIEKNVNKIGESKFWTQFDAILKIEKEYEGKNTKIQETQNQQDQQNQKQIRYMSGNITDTEAYNEVLSPAKETFSLFQQSRGYLNSPTLNNLMQKRGVNGRSIVGGNDEYDNIFMTMLGKYAVKDDGQVTNSELTKAVQESDKDKTLQAAYKGSDKDSYVAALEAMLTRLFGKITIAAQ